MGANLGEKILAVNKAADLIAAEKIAGHSVVQCHGVFDLLHPGHIRHLQEAKNLGDKLIVTVTPDKHVNKGPGRPVFNQNLRIESLAALEFVDYVVLNEEPDAISIINSLKPNIYVKGIEYKKADQDITGKISKEEEAVRSIGGEIHFTEDIVFSSSELLNGYFNIVPQEIKDYFAGLKQRYQTKELIDMVSTFADLKVLVVGDAIIDEYQYVSALGQSGKGSHMAARCLSRDVFAGGSFAVANHVAEFTKNVTLLTAVGGNDPYASLIDKTLNKNIDRQFVLLPEQQTLVKKRYVMREGKILSKLFETYSSDDNLLGANQTERMCKFVDTYAKDYDLVLVCDFANGLTNRDLIFSLSQVPTFLAVNTQTNSGNRGYNVITHYQRADYITLNEPEIRLTAHDRYGDLGNIVNNISEMMDARRIAVTRGVNGLYLYDREIGAVQIPAMATNVVDRVGAGDCYLAVSSMAMVKNLPTEIGGLLGSVAAALNVQTVGNEKPVDKVSMCKYLTTLMK